MSRNPEPAKRRLLDAALEEFSSRGLAGGRVDSIAASASSNKQLIYQHFSSKDGLFDAVFERMVAGFIENVPITPDNLPDYAGRLFDYYQAHPKLLRLATWYRLERELTAELARTSVRVAADKIVAIEAAQAAGLVSVKFAASDLLAMVIALSQVGSPISMEAVTSQAPLETTRAAIVKAVAELTAP